MELDDLKNTWNNGGNKEQQQNLTSKLIDQMTQKKYNSKINKIAYPEIIGSVICLLATIFIGLNFYKLDTTFLQGVGVISILVLLTLSVVSFLSLRQLKITNDFSKPYAETLKIFATQKLEFYKLQKINMTLSYLLLVTVIILVSKFFSGRDITDSKYFWTFSFSFGYIFLLFFSKFVTRFYKSTLRKSEELLQELQT
ncbi:MAG TPA: hypothetical protein VLZ83_11200 [Edaphocola sp.]|nr:hypothetical protein [Edaphocola sp.]